MYNVKANVLDDKIHTIATNNMPPDAAVAADFTADIRAYESISIIQPKFVREPVSTEPVTSVDYPNILATDVTHPQTGEPLFYYHRIPKVTTSGKNISDYISITDKDGNVVDKNKYYILTTDNEVRIYTNLLNSADTLYFVNAIFFKNTPRIGYVHEMLNVRKALEYNVDYSVTYTNGEYILSKPLYVTSDPDRMMPVLIPSNYDISSPWRIEIPPITMPTYTVAKSHISSSVFTTDANKLSDGIYRVNTYDAYTIKDDNGLVESFDSHGYIYAPKANEDTLHVTVIRKNTNQFIPNIAGDSTFNIYCVNGMVIKLTEDRSDLQKIATVYVNKSGNIQITRAAANGGGLADDNSDEFKPSLFVKIGNMNLRTTADRSTYDATYPISKGITVVQFPIKYSASLGKGDSQRLTDTIAQSKATGSEMLTIDSNGFEITKGYFAKVFNDLTRISDIASVPAPIKPKDTPILIDNASATLDSPYESKLHTSDDAIIVSGSKHEYVDNSNITDSVQYISNVNEHSDPTFVSDFTFVDKVTTLTDAAKADHDVAY